MKSNKEYYNAQFYGEKSGFSDDLYHRRINKRYCLLWKSALLITKSAVLLEIKTELVKNSIKKWIYDFVEKKSLAKNFWSFLKFFFQKQKDKIWVILKIETERKMTVRKLYL